MSNVRIILFIFFHTIFCFATTEANLSRIIIDGISEDFTNDEAILTNPLGYILESPTDSYWGVYNDVKQIKVTWDSSYLYLAVDACSWNNNVLLFIDIYDDYGIEDMSKLNAWPRSFKFYNWNPDFFIGTWDTNNTPQFWKVQEGGSIQVEQNSTIETSATFDTGNIYGAMEIKIPWGTLYFDQEHSLSSFPSIKLLAVITSGDDHSSGPDCAPDNLGGMANNSGQIVILDNYAEIVIDEDGDGPDMNINPQQRTTFLKAPPFEAIPLSIQNVKFVHGKTFAPLLNEEISFELETNRNSEFTVEIFDVNGTFINYAINIEPLHWKWDGRNINDDIVPFGIYILCFIANSSEISHKESVVVIK
tara:strand:+ start:442 stop:1527 length:1086 start_codon:yes stop_codon:yes gene_type:complete